MTSPVTPDEQTEIGYRGATACAAAGISYRQLDYWARTGLLEPSVRTASGSGTARLYGFRDILVLKIVKRLLDAGVSLQNIRTAVNHLRSRGVVELESITSLATLQGEMNGHAVTASGVESNDELTLRRKAKGA